MLKAEDLLAQEQYIPSSGAFKKEGNLATKIKVEPSDDPMDVDDLAPPAEDLSGKFRFGGQCEIMANVQSVAFPADIKIEPDEGEIELQLALSKARKMKLKAVREDSVEQIAKVILENSDRYGVNTRKLHVLKEFE